MQTDSPPGSATRPVYVGSLRLTFPDSPAGRAAAEKGRAAAVRFASLTATSPVHTPASQSSSVRGPLHSPGVRTVAESRTPPRYYPVAASPVRNHQTASTASQLSTRSPPPSEPPLPSPSTPCCTDLLTAAAPFQHPGNAPDAPSSIRGWKQNSRHAGCAGLRSPHPRSPHLRPQVPPHWPLHQWPLLWRTVHQHCPRLLTPMAATKARRV